MKSTQRTSVVLRGWALVGNASTVAANMPVGDDAGSKDDPRLSRYPGSVIVGYLKRPLDETDLIAGVYNKSGANTLPFEKTMAKTELRTDSKPSMVEIAELLNRRPKLNVYVVGHG